MAGVFLVASVLTVAAWVVAAYIAYRWGRHKAAIYRQAMLNQLSNRRALLRSMTESESPFSSHLKNLLINLNSNTLSGEPLSAQAENALSEALGNMFSDTGKNEKYAQSPDYLSLRDRLVRVEDAITEAHEELNMAVSEVNVLLGMLPLRLLKKLLNLQRLHSLFVKGAFADRKIEFKPQRYPRRKPGVFGTQRN